MGGTWGLLEEAAARGAPCYHPHPTRSLGTSTAGSVLRAGTCSLSRNNRKPGDRSESRDSAPGLGAMVGVGGAGQFLDGRCAPPGARRQGCALSQEIPATVLHRGFWVVEPALICIGTVLATRLTVCRLWPPVGF